MFGHKLVVVEADQELCLELLPLTAEQPVLMLSAKPAGGIITSEAGQGPNWPNLWDVCRELIWQCLKVKNLFDKIPSLTLHTRTVGHIPNFRCLYYDS